MPATTIATMLTTDMKNGMRTSWDVTKFEFNALFKLSSTFSSNPYINGYLKKSIHRNTSERTTINKSISYVGKSSERIVSLLRDQDQGIAYALNNSLEKYIKNAKRINDMDKKKPRVYKLTRGCYPPSCISKYQYVLTSHYSSKSLYPKTSLLSLSDHRTVEHRQMEYNTDTILWHHLF